MNPNKMKNFFDHVTIYIYVYFNVNTTTFLPYSATYKSAIQVFMDLFMSISTYEH